MENQSLLEECADWVAAQLEEENIFIDPALVTLIMDVERRLGPPKSASTASAQAIETLMLEDGINGVPDSINAVLIYAVLQWEDEFMALAGRARPA